MSWNITPADAAVFGAQALNDRFFVDQFWYAIAERLQATGSDAPFPQNHTWDTFHIDSITDNGDGTFTLVDGSKSWVTAAGHNRWTGATPGETGVPTFAPTSYDVVIDADRTSTGLSEPDQRAVIQAPIIDQPTTPATHLKCTFNLATFINERGITAVSDLVGHNGWIIKRDGLNYTRGFIKWPNAKHYAYGLFANVATNTTAHTTSIQSDRKLQHPADLAAKEIIYLDAGDLLQRRTIASVDDATSLTFSGDTNPPVVGQPFYIIDAGGYWQWGRTPGSVQCAFAGLTTPYFAHATSADNTTNVGMPRLTYPVFYGTDPLSCPVDPDNVILRGDADGLDVDYIVPFDNVCDDPDVILQPNWWQCWRALWVGAFRLSTSFVKPVDWTGYGGVSIPTFTYATWLAYVGINNVTGTTGTHSGTSMPCTLSVPHTPVNLWWTIVDANGTPLLSGYTDTYNGSTINGTFSAAHDGKTVIASVGPTRLVPRAFVRMFPVTYFVPSLDGDPEAAQLPPSDTFPGTWTILPASTHGLVSDKDGFVGESTLSRHAIGDGQYWRYVGHRRDDPGFPALLPADVDQPLATYHDYAYTGKRQPAVENSINSGLGGTATGGSNRRVVVSGVDFDGLDFMPGTNGLTHTFTAASGSTTGCTVPGVSGTGLWASARFPGFSGPFVGFCVEFLMSGTGFSDPAAVIEKRLITTGTTAGVITWVEATSVSVDGKPGRIVEPFVLNPFKGLPIALVAADGTTGSAVVEGSHGDTLFISDPDLAVDAGTHFTIFRPQIGDVYKRVSGAWVTTSGMGADTRYGGSTFQENAAANLEDIMTEYGLPLPTDVTFSQQLGPDELYDAINALTKTVGATPSAHTDSNFSRDASWHNETTSWSDFANHVINGDGSGFPNYFLNPARLRDSATPQAGFSGSGAWTWNGSAWVVSAGWTGSVIRQSSKYTVTPPQAPWSKTVEFYDFSTKGSYETYDANSDSVAENEWYKFSSGTTTTATVTSATLGSTAAPDECAAPASSSLAAGTSVGQSGSVSHSQGYVVTSLASLVDWAFKFLA